MRLRWSILLFGVLCPPATAAELQTTSTPYPGVTYQRWADAAIPARIHLLRIDLSSSELSVHATSEAQRGIRPSQFAAATGSQIAINGDFFSPVDFRPDGMAMGQAMLWSGTTDDDRSGFLRFDRNGDRTNASISAPEDVVAAGDLEPGTQGVVGGRPMLVRTGVAQSTFDCADQVAMPCQRAPRTAVAVSADGNTLWLVVVDGWQAGSLGMTAGELGGFLDGLGVRDALMFDGGAAATMWVAGMGGQVSSPSDGVERTVANHLAVRHGVLPPGQLVGFIRERDIFDSTANISGALVELDDGTSMLTGADGRYLFNGVTPRYACVTASKTGYHSDTQCKQVISSEVVYNSIALFPNSDFIDAGPGVPDAGPTADGAPPADAAPPADGIDGDAGDGGGGDGCCGAGASPPGPLLFFVIWWLVRRRP